MVTGMKTPTWSYSGNLMGVRVRVTPLSNLEAHVVLGGGGLGAHVEGVAVARPRNKVVLDDTLHRTLAGRLCTIESVQYTATGDALLVRLNMPMMDATLRMMRDDADRVDT